MTKDIRKCVVNHGKVIVTRQQTPKLISGHLLVQVHAVCLTSVDIPVAGSSFSGTILQACEGSKWQSGAKIWGRIDSGALADIILVPDWAIYKMKTTMTFEEASTLAGPCLMSCKALQMASLPAEGRPKVLIHGGHTGVGTFAIQSSRVLRCDVEATTPLDFKDQCRDLGVGDFVDLQDGTDNGTILASFRGRRPRNFHLVIDTICDDTSIYDMLERFTHEGAKYVTLKPQSISWTASFKRTISGSPREYAYLDGRITKDDAGRWFELVARLINSPEFISIELQDEYDFEDLEAAIRAAELNTGFGCIVVNVSDPNDELFQSTLAEYMYHGQIKVQER